MRSEIIVPVILSESIIQGKDGGRSENEGGGSFNVLILILLEWRKGRGRKPPHTVAIWTFTFHKISGFVRVILKANFKQFYKPKVSIF